MLFLNPPNNAIDIREFCRRFNEGMRVEYKSTFDGNVRRSLAKMLSSFANSLGGIAIIGVNAVDGVPRDPIEGFDLPTEEPTLVIEQICLQGLNPPLVPKITQVPSDVPGRCFLVIEVDESIEAPHAIENCKKVYVRTGNASNPYDLADVNLIMELFTRRREFLKRRDEMVRLQEERAQNLFASGTQMVVEVSIGPTLPRRAIVDRQGVWDFMEAERYRGGRFFPGESLRRTNDGVLGRIGQSSMGDLTQHGFLFWKTVVEFHQMSNGDNSTNFWDFGSVLRSVFKAILCAARFYTATHYPGPVRIVVRLSNCFQQSMPFIGWDQFGLDDFRCLERNVAAEEISDAEVISARFDLLVDRLMSQLCWSFWQPPEPFPAQLLAQSVSNSIRSMGTR